MSNITIDFGDLRQFEKVLHESPALAQAQAKRAMYDSVKKVQEIARREAPRGVSSPGLKNSIFGKVESWHRGVVGVSEVIKHARAIEFGTKPHAVNPEALHDWVRLKLHVKNYRSVAFLIARKIRRRGTKAQPYMATAFQDTQPFIKRAFEIMIENVILKLYK
jgi:hypothetical protein